MNDRERRAIRTAVRCTRLLVEYGYLEPGPYDAAVVEIVETRTSNGTSANDRS